MNLGRVRIVALGWLGLCASACVGDFSRRSTSSEPAPQAEGSVLDGGGSSPVSPPEDEVLRPEGQGGTGSLQQGGSESPSTAGAGGQGPNPGDSGPPDAGTPELDLDGGTGDAGAPDASQPEPVPVPVPCGKEGESCCAAASACSAGLTCRASSCTRCASLRSLGPLSYAEGVSADGSMAVGSVDKLAYRWSTTDPGELRRSLGRLPGSLDSNVIAAGVAASADGTVVVGHSFWTLTGTNGTERGFRWTASTDMNDMGDLPGVAEGAFRSSALATSADGNTVVGAMSDGLRERAFRWEQGQSFGEDLGDLPDSLDANSTATGVSADGKVVVGSTIDASGTRAFRWALEGRSMEDLGHLPDADPFSLNTIAYAISGDGLVVVGVTPAADSLPVGFRWTRATGMIALGGVTVGTSSRATATNADGTVIVGSTDYASDTGAALWVFRPQPTVALVSDRMPRSLLAEWELTAATGVSGDGITIVGNGRYQGEPEAWVAVLGANCEED